MKSTLEKHKLGPSFSGTWHILGILIFIPTIILFIKQELLGLASLLLPASIILMLSIRVIMIDYSQKRIRNTLYLFPFKVGRWQALSNFSKLILLYHQESYTTTHHDAFYRKNSTVKHYDIYLISKLKKDSNILLYRGKSIRKAQEKLDEFSKKLEIEKEDLIRKTWDKYKKEKNRLKRKP